MQPAVSISGITKSFDGNIVLKGIDLDIAVGDVIGLVGENGAGKSTCMNVIAGSLQPDSGHISIAGERVQIANVADGLARGIRFIHQELSLVPALTVGENIFLGDYCAGPKGWLNKPRLMREARAVLARVGASHISPAMLVETLRAGDQQLVEIAKALTADPSLLIMDEPTSSLTEHEASGLFALVKDLAAAGTAVIFITHRLEEVLAVCNRVVVFRDGEKVSDRNAPVTRDEILADMIGSASVFATRKSNAVSGNVVLRANEVTDGNLSGMSFELQEGEILGAFGLVGSGRTELLETIYGRRARVGGELWLADRRGDEGSSGAAAQLHMVTESRKTSGIFPSHSVAANITISSLPEVSRMGVINAQAEAKAANEMKRVFGIRASSLNMPITQLSGGNQQKALMARAYMAAPDILLLDEPTHGVDVGAKEEIYALIRQMASRGIAIILASSEVPELMAIADRCLVLSQQKLTGVLSHSEMSEASLLKLAFSEH